MPTDKPKISIYVPQATYDRFVEFQQEKGCSMSEAGEIILAEFFSLPREVKVDVATIENLQEKVAKLEDALTTVKDLEKKVAKLEKSFAETNNNIATINSDRFNGMYKGRTGKILRTKASGADIELDAKTRLFFLFDEFTSA